MEVCQEASRSGALAARSSTIRELKARCELFEGEGLAKFAEHGLLDEDALHFERLHLERLFARHGVEPLDAHDVFPQIGGVQVVIHASSLEGKVENKPLGRDREEVQQTERRLYPDEEEEGEEDAELGSTC